jgi:hypothetical protein
MEMLLALGLLAFFSMAIYFFAWNIETLNTRGELMRALSSESRFLSERLSFLIRNSDGIANISGNRLELEKAGSSGTIGIFERNGVLFADDGGNEEALSGSDIAVTDLSFEDHRAESGLSEAVGFSWTLSTGTDALPDSAFRSSMMARGVALIRKRPIP